LATSGCCYEVCWKWPRQWTWTVCKHATRLPVLAAKAPFSCAAGTWAVDREALRALEPGGANFERRLTLPGQKRTEFPAFSVLQRILLKHECHSQAFEFAAKFLFLSR
jgi:hypothetical protein